MEWPMVGPAPVVTEHAAIFRDLCDHQCQFRPVQPYLTGLIVLPKQSLAHMARGILDSADNTHLARVLSKAPWREDAVNRRRLRCMLQQTKPQRRRRRESLVVLDDTWCEHVGSLFEPVDRHDHHGDGPYPLAHHPVTRFYVRGPVRFPLDRRRYRRDEELTQWEASVAEHVPDLTIPPDKKSRNRRHTQVDPVVLQAPDGRARHEPCRTNMARAIELVEAAIRRQVPCGVVVFDAWYVAEDVVRVWTRRRTDWISLLHTNRRLDTASFQGRDAHGWPLQLPGPHLAVEALVPLIPATAYRPVTVKAHTYWCFTLAVRIPGLGKVRIVVSCEHESLTGRSVVLVTNRVDGSAAKSISLYGQRWPTETCDQDGQGHLGFNDYRRRSAEAMGTHGCVVFVASALWHLTCLPTVPERTRGLIQTRGDACRQQGRARLQKLLVFVHDQRSHGTTAEDVLTLLGAMQRRMLPV
jgi:DDE superfamily endonuclease